MSTHINPYEDKWTPLFDALPKGLNVADRATFGQIKRRCDMTGKKCTASAQTIAEAIGASEKTVDRAFAKLMKYGLILRIFNGKASRTPSHYIIAPKSQWKLKELEAFSHQKSEKISDGRKKSLGSICPKTRDNLSPTRVNLSHKDTKDTSTRYSKKNSNLNVSPLSEELFPRTVPLGKKSKGGLLRAATAWDGNIDGEKLYMGMEAE